MALETSRSIREDYLHQNAFHKVDTYTSMEKQYELLGMIMYLHKQSLAAIAKGVSIEDIFKLPVREEIARAKYIPQEEIAKVVKIRETIDSEIAKCKT